MAVANWLAASGLLAVRLSTNAEQLQEIDGRVITWWELIVERPPKPTYVDLAKTLRKLHDLPGPGSFALSRFDPMPRVQGRLEAAADFLPFADRDFITARASDLHRSYQGLTFVLATGAIHGDAHLGNLMRRDDGSIVLIDLEAFAWGPREWDASVFGAAYAAFGWMDRDEYRRCVDAYRWDPLSWDGFHTLRQIRELNMTTWLLQRAGESAEVDEEIARRLADLRNDELPRRWHQL